MPSLGTVGDGSNVGGGRGGGGGGWDDTDEGGNDVWDQDDEWGDLFEDTDVGGGADGGADVDDAQLGRNTRTESARSLPSAGLAMQTKKTTKMNFTKPKPKSKPATIGLGRSTKPERKKSPLHKVVPDSPSQKKKKEDDLFGSVRRVLRASPLFLFLSLSSFACPALSLLVSPLYCSLTHHHHQSLPLCSVGHGTCLREEDNPRREEDIIGGCCFSTPHKQRHS